MNESELPADLIRFLHSSVPTYPAAVVLVFLARAPETSWTPQAVVERIQPTLVSLAAVEEYVDHFARAGLIRRDPDGTFHYHPDSDEARAGMDALIQAYDQRPVTLVRTIYSIANAKIQSFADAFKLKRDP